MASHAHPLIAQAFGAYSIVQILVIAIVLGAVWYIATSVLPLPATVKTIVNVVLVAVAAIVAIRFLAAFI